MRPCAECAAWFRGGVRVRASSTTAGCFPRLVVELVGGCERVVGDVIHRVLECEDVAGDLVLDVDDELILEHDDGLDLV